MIVTVPYMYRDASNYKAHSCIRVSGTLTSEQVERVRASCELECFIPGQVSALLMHLGTELASFPYDDDHPWHELDLDDIEEAADDTAPAHMSPEAFVSAFEKASSNGWDELYYLDSLGV